VQLPDLAAVPGRPFGIYVHVPFCATRCGYCDFNTYTPAELGGANPDGWLAALRTELGLAASRLGVAPPRVDTVFGGGGPPSMLVGDGLAAVLDGIREHFTLAEDAEVTTEANPESTSPAFFEQLRTAGFTRLSLGMQSVVPHVLAVLDRVHSPGRPLDAARCEYLRGHILRDSSTDQAREALETAAEDADRYGVHHLAELARSQIPA